MSETKLDFTGNADQAQATIDKLVKKTAQLTEQMRTMKAESVKGAKSAGDAHEGLAISIGKAALKVTSLGAVIGTAYGDWERRLDDIARRHDELERKMGKGLSESGSLDKTPATKDWLSKMNKEGVTKDHALTALEQTSKAGELSPERQKDIAAEAARFGKTGADVGKLGRLMAEMDKGSGGEMSPGDIADSAMMAQRLLGDKATKFTDDRWQKELGRLRESGMSGKESINTAMHAMGRDEKGNALELVDKKLRHQPMSTEERKDYKRLFDPESIKEVGSKMERARSTDFAAQQLAATPGALEGENIVQLKKDANESRYGAGVSAVGKVQEARREGLESQGGFSAWVQRAMDQPYRAADAASRFLGLESAEGQAASLAGAGVKAGQLSGGEAGALLAELKAQTAMMKQDRPQKPINIDRHTE